MNLFYADLHLHSRFSRATSKALSLKKLAAWGALKGLDVLTTGDFTHPEWMQEIQEHLEQEENGLFKLRDHSGLEREIPWLEGTSLQCRTRFMLGTEISSIYKRGGVVRKVHNLVFMPSLDAAAKFNTRLAQVGNLASDGRPILGLDSRDLLDMVLETAPGAYLVPAHIWTPWFSLFGSKSGFDSIEDCFGSLSREIFALETGLSSDPEMNWLWSALDRFRLVSNSDAHSGEKLAREANVFSGEPGYETIFKALKNEGVGHAFLGTVEFFPEEGKYHLDGHRKCGVVLDPRESQKLGSICPVCGKPLTVGVLNRVMSLADREQPEQPKGSPGYTSLIPLPEVLSEILNVGPRTKTVFGLYARLVHAFGSELNVLQHVPLESLQPYSRALAEGIRRMRHREVFRDPGFDGQFGRISVFTREERQELHHGRSLIEKDMRRAGAQAPSPPAATPSSSHPGESAPSEQPDVVFNPAQEEALSAGPNPVLVVAGPGTGKTRTLIGRVIRLLKNGTNPRHILILTFTRAAARELQDRLVAVFGQTQAMPRADTLHALAYENWLSVHRDPPVLLGDDDGQRIFAQANPELSKQQRNLDWKALNLAREKRSIPEELSQAAQNYFQYKDRWNLVDYTDLLDCWLEQIQDESFSHPYTHVLVDEVQDLSPLQLQLITAMVPENGQGAFAIGDPKQSIYGFRGAVTHIQGELEEHWEDLKLVSLEENYRSRQNLLDFIHPLMPQSRALKAHLTGSGELVSYQSRTGEQEAQWTAERIRDLLGGTAHRDADLGRGGELAPGDIAVLVRFKGLIPPFERTLTRLGIPCTVPEKTPFWQEPRIELILNTVSRFLGIAPDPDIEILDCPDRILAEGPERIAAYFQNVKPFDSIFWKSQPFQELKRAFAQHEGWSNLVSWTRLESELSRVRDRADKVRIMTLHAAKGLEFEAVFMPALEEGILPFAGRSFLSGRPQDEEERPDLDEERRLMYVGLTRARKLLFLSSSAARRIYGRNYQLKPSSFLEALPLDRTRRIRSVAQKKQKQRQLKLL